MSELRRVAPWEDGHRQSALLPSALGSRCLLSERCHPLRQAVAAERVILVHNFLKKAGIRRVASTVKGEAFFQNAYFQMCCFLKACKQVGITHGELDG